VRLRVRFTKLGKVRFTSHRDVARIWERALRKVALPVTYTSGFSPRPKLAFGLALSTGHESVAEYLDVDLDEVPTLDDLPVRLSAGLPAGMDVTACAPVPPGSASLQESVISCSWKIEATGVDVPAAEALVSAALAADTLPLTRTRKGREVTDDLRPALLHVAVTGRGEGGGAVLEAELGVHPRSLRPSELLLVLSPDGAVGEGRVLRTAQWTFPDGARREPLATSTREDRDVRDHTGAAAPPGGAHRVDQPEPALRGA
jgi:radical SAM-linked protein